MMGSSVPLSLWRWSHHNDLPWHQQAMGCLLEASCGPTPTYMFSSRHSAVRFTPSTVFHDQVHIIIISLSDSQCPQHFPLQFSVSWTFRSQIHAVSSVIQCPWFFTCISPWVSCLYQYVTVHDMSLSVSHYVFYQYFTVHIMSLLISYFIRQSGMCTWDWMW